MDQRIFHYKLPLRLVKKFSKENQYHIKMLLAYLVRIDFQVGFTGVRKYNIRHNTCDWC